MPNNYNKTRCPAEAKSNSRLSWAWPSLAPACLGLSYVWFNGWLIWGFLVAWYGWCGWLYLGCWWGDRGILSFGCMILLFLTFLVGVKALWVGFLLCCGVVATFQVLVSWWTCPVLFVLGHHFGFSWVWFWGWLFFVFLLVFGDRWGVFRWVCWFVVGIWGYSSWGCVSGLVLRVVSSAGFMAVRT